MYCSVAWREVKQYSGYQLLDPIYCKNINMFNLI